MTWLPRLQSLWRNLAHRDGVEHEIDDEITALEALLVEEKRAAGLTSAEAHRAARLELGGPRQLKERVGEAKAGALLDTLWRDIRYAVRRLRQDSGFTLAAGVALSLGLGVNTMLFTIFNAHTIRELPIPGASEVVDLSSRNERDERRGLSYREFEDVRSSSQSFEAIAAVAMRPVALGDDTLAPDRARGAYVSAKLFEVLRDLPSLGRGFLVDDERPGAPGVVVLAASLWRERYGADPRVLGRTVTINGVPATVVGIASDQFRFTFPMIADIFVPLAASPGVREESRDQRGYSVFGRLRADATLVRVRSELEGLGSRLTAEHPDTNRGVRLTAVPISERFLGDPTSPVWLAFMTAGILVALIGCANVANLLTMRCAQRSQEIAIRASLGASRRRIVGQLLVESLVLALLGAALGWGLALGGLSLFASLIPAGTLPPWMHYAPDLRVFAVVAAGCIGSVFVFGLAPSLYVSKTDFNNVLKDGGRMGAHLKRSRRWTGLFLTLQFALTVVFVSQLAIARQQVEERRRSEVVVDTTNVVTMWMNLAGERYIASDARLRMIDQLGDELEGTAALSSLSFASALPMEGAALRELDIPGQQMVPGSDLPVVSVVSAGDRYFETLGLPLAQGRAFNELDGMPGHEYVIVNERFATVHFGGRNPVGRRIRLRADGDTDPPWLTIIGVSPNVRQRQMPDPDPVVYLPLRQQAPSTVALIVRTAGDPAPLTKTIRDVVRGIDAGLPVFRILPLDQVMRDATWNPRVSATLFNSLTLIAVCLATVGLYAVTSYSVVRRTHELGLRMALGARARHVMWLVLRGSGGHIAAGLALGLGCTVVWERLFGSSAGSAATSLADPSVLATITGILAAVAVLACAWPASRAIRVNPVEALREG